MSKMKKVYIAGDKYDNAKAAKQILEAIEDLESIGIADVLNRNRPYNGQDWTDDGKRGKTLVEGLTMRDVRDCFILALYDSRPPNCEAPKSVEDLPLDDMSLEAIGQNMGSWIERYMGIFPNVPEKFK